MTYYLAFTILTTTVGCRECRGTSLTVPGNVSTLSSRADRQSIYTVSVAITVAGILILPPIAWRPDKYRTPTTTTLKKKSERIISWLIQHDYSVATYYCETPNNGSLPRPHENVIFSRFLPHYLNGSIKSFWQLKMSPPHNLKRLASAYGPILGGFMVFTNSPSMMTFQNLITTILNDNIQFL